MKEKKQILNAKVNKKNVPKVYKKVSRFYDTWGKLTESKARDKCLELAGIKNGDSVLEVAVGTGLAFEKILISNPDGNNVGIDLTEDMLNKAREKADKLKTVNYSLEVGDAYSLKYKDNSFDVVINNYMFDLLPVKDFEKILKEFKRILKPGGRLVMVNMTKPERWYNNIWEIIYKINPAWIGGCRGVLVADKIKKLGFRNITRQFISQFTFPSEVIFAVK